MFKIKQLPAQLSMDFPPSSANLGHLLLVEEGLLLLLLGSGRMPFLTGTFLGSVPLLLSKLWSSAEFKATIHTFLTFWLQSFVWKTMLTLQWIAFLTRPWAMFSPSDYNLLVPAWTYMLIFFLWYILCFKQLNLLLPNPFSRNHNFKIRVWGENNRTESKLKWHCKDGSSCTFRILLVTPGSVTIQPHCSWSLTLMSQCVVFVATATWVEAQAL